MLMAIDFETYLIDGNGPFPKPVCLSYYDGEQADLVSTMPDMLNTLTNILTNDQTIAHNATFEAGVIYNHFPSLRPLLFTAMQEGRIICTKICEQLLNTQREKPTYKLSLAGLVEHYFDTDISASKKDPDAWRLRYSELEGVPLHLWPQDATSYAIQDSIWAYKIYQEQQVKTYALSVNASILLNIMGMKGINVDISRVELLEKEIKEKLKPKYEFLVEKGLCSYTKNGTVKKNVKALQTYVEALIKDPLETLKGNIKVDREALMAYYVETQDPVFEAFIFINKFEKVNATYVANLKSPLIRSNYETVKVTGRTSSYGSKLYPSVNIQNIPRNVDDVTWDIRNCFIPRPGYKFFAIDYAGLELCSAAQQLYKFYGKSKMRDVINSGKDLHSNFARKIVEIAEKRPVSYDEFINNMDKYKQYRTQAKPINLGFPGGVGYDTMRTILLQYGIKSKFKILEKAKSEEPLRNLLWMLKKDCPDLRIARLNKRNYALVYDELIALKRALFEIYPELEKFLTDGHKKFLTGKEKPVMNEYGEWEQEPMYQYQVGEFKRGWSVYTAICNGYLMQTPSALGAKKMVCEVLYKYLDHPAVRPVAFIHDEMVLEVKDNVHKYAYVEDVSYMMIRAMKEQIPDVRITVEASEMDYWSKSNHTWEEKYYE